MTKRNVEDHLSPQLTDAVLTGKLKKIEKGGVAVRENKERRQEDDEEEDDEDSRQYIEMVR